MNNIIPIVMIASDDIIDVASVTVVSIAHNSSSPLEFYFLERSSLPISSRNRNKLARLKDQFKNIQSFNYHSVDENHFANVGKSSEGYVPVDTFFRYLIPNVAPKFRKCIYIDVDTVVLKDISELFNYPLNGSAIGAVRNDKGQFFTDQVREVTKICGLKQPENYFNAGVLLIDCLKWRDIEATDKLITLSESKRDILKWADQDTLNIFFENDNIELPDRFNKYYFRVNGNELPVVVHFVGPKKPWLTADSSCYECFWKYARLSPWYKNLRKKQEQSSCLREFRYYFLGIFFGSKKVYSFGTRFYIIKIPVLEVRHEDPSKVKFFNIEIFKKKEVKRI